MLPSKRKEKNIKRTSTTLWCILNYRQFTLTAQLLLKIKQLGKNVKARFIKSTFTTTTSTCVFTGSALVLLVAVAGLASLSVSSSQINYALSGQPVSSYQLLITHAVE